MNTFQELRLPSPIARALAAMNFTAPTPIQAEAIPVALANRDLIGCAQTGTGKTLAFCLPTLTRLMNQPGKSALILAPTRELVAQIELVWKNLSRFLPEMQCASIIGGMSMKAQVRALSKKPRVVIATPGRLVDHLNRRNVNLSQCDVLILDEADRMLDMGFAPQLNQILRHVPQKRQTLLFTATWAPEMDQLSKKYLRDPARVSIGPVSRPAAQVEQSLISTTSKQKNEALLDELNQRQGSVLVFARTKSRTDRVAHYLESYGVRVNRLHGGRSQGQRTSALSAFRNGQIRVLVATDIAARGIDVQGIAHVINYDLPQSAEDYVHRIGRTGRAGASGNAVSLITPEDRSQWNEITRLLKKSGARVPAQPQSGPVRSAPSRMIPMRMN